MRRLLLPVVAVLGLFFAWPLALVLQNAASPDAWAWLASDYARNRLAIALQQGLLSLGLAFTIAVPLAVLHHHFRIPGSRVLLTLHAAPFVMPVFVVVGGLQEVAGPGGWLDQAIGLDVFTTLGPLGAIVLANAYYNAGLAARLLHTALRHQPVRLAQAAATLGAAPLAAAARIHVPLLAPAFASTALLVLLFCLGSFGVVLLLGEGQVDTLDTLLYANLRGAFPRVDRGAVLAVVQILFQATMLAAVLALERRAARYVAHEPREPTRSHPAATAVAWTAAAATLVPLAAVLAGGFRLRGNWSLQPWRTLFDPAAPGHLGAFDLGNALAWSLAYALLAVTFALALTACLAYAARNASGTRLARVAEAFAALPLGTSSVVLGFGFLLAFTGRTWLPLTGSPLLVVAAQTLLAFPFTARVVLPALRSIDERLDAAAATLGASPARIAWRIHAPLLRRPIAAAAAFAAALSLGDYGASLLLMTEDIMSLAVWTGRHRGFDPLLRAQGTALAGLLLALTLAAFLAFEAAAKRSASRRMPR